MNHHRVLSAVVLACGLTASWAEPRPSSGQVLRGAPDQSTAAEPRAELRIPSVRVSGTVISSTEKHALIVIMDERGKEIRTVLAKEGDTVQGYRVARINRDQVSFEQGGRTVTIAVGNERPSIPRIVPDVPYEGKRDRTAEFAPPPENVAEFKRGAELLFEELRQNPEFQGALDALRSRALERLQVPPPTAPPQ